MAGDVRPEYVKKRSLILGCGNILFGDDGFGPVTVEYILSNLKVPDDVYVMDVGTGVRDILFTVALSEEKPEKIVIIDGVDVGKRPGEVFEITVEELPQNKVSDFSMHQFPATNLLKELRDVGGVDVVIIACQVERIPELVSPGLSDTVKSSILKAAELALEHASNS